jgi:hypothetical protein
MTGECGRMWSWHIVKYMYFQFREIHWKSIEELTGCWIMHRLIVWLIVRLSDWLSDCLIDCLIVWLIVWLIVRLSDWLSYCLIVWLSDWLIDCLIDRLIVLLSDRLIPDVHGTVLRQPECGDGVLEMNFPFATNSVIFSECRIKVDGKPWILMWIPICPSERND